MFDFNDWGSWGVGDFYNGSEEELREAIKSGKPFDTGWHGFKKEPQSMRIYRDEDGVTVNVSECMDEALEQTDLFYDFLADDEYDLLTDDILEDIRGYLYFGDFVEEIEDSGELPADATFEQIIKKANDLINNCSEILHNSFLECISTTLYVMYDGNMDRDTIIEERINKYK